MLKYCQYSVKSKTIYRIIDSHQYMCIGHSILCSLPTYFKSHVWYTITHNITGVIHHIQLYYQCDTYLTPLPCHSIACNTLLPITLGCDKPCITNSITGVIHHIHFIKYVLHHYPEYKCCHTSMPIILLVWYIVTHNITNVIQVYHNQ